MDLNATILMVGNHVLFSKFVEDPGDQTVQRQPVVLTCEIQS